MSELMSRFYETKKDLFDISGNIINQDKYPFMSVLAGYLTDIVSSIDQEIKNNSRASSINWKEKKNPKLLSRFINNDDNINIINRCINKITGNNYKEIAIELIESLEKDGTHNTDDYSKYIFDSIIKKCIIEELFCNDYIAFLNIISGNIGEQSKILLNNFVIQVSNILKTNEYIKNISYFNFIKDVIQFQNIGMIFGCIYTQYKNSLSSIKMNENDIISDLCYNIESVNSIIDWQPVDINELASRSYLLCGIIESTYKNISKYFQESQVSKIKECLNLLYNFNGGLPNKLKFKILDIQDIVKKYSNKVVESIKTIKPIEPVKKIENVELIEPAFTVKSKKIDRKQYKKEVMKETEIIQPLVVSTNNRFDLLEVEGLQVTTQELPESKIYKPKKSTEFAKDGSDIYGKKKNNLRK